MLLTHGDPHWHHTLKFVAGVRGLKHCLTLSELSCLSLSVVCFHRLWCCGVELDRHLSREHRIYTEACFQCCTVIAHLFWRGMNCTRVRRHHARTICSRPCAVRRIRSPQKRSPSDTKIVLTSLMEGGDLSCGLCQHANIVSVREFKIYSFSTPTLFGIAEAIRLKSSPCSLNRERNKTGDRVRRTMGKVSVLAHPCPLLTKFRQSGWPCVWQSFRFGR